MSAAKTLCVIILLALLGAGTGFAIYSLTSSHQGSRSLEVVPVTIDQLRLNIPQNFLRGGSVSSTDTSERVDIIIRFPEMVAAGIPPTTTTDMVALNPRHLLFLAILRGDGILDPAERPNELYGRFLEPDTWQNPGGLLLRRFESSSPYGDEELFLAPPDGRVFAARCRKPGKSTESIGEACVWRFRQNGADIQLRFSPDLLPQWETMAMGIGTLLKQWSGK
jgi:hypothetical protein